MVRLPLLVAVSALALAAPAASQTPGPPAAAPAEPQPMIEFEADELQFDERQDIVTATGNVVLRRDDQVLTADTVVWNRRDGRVEASGNVLVADSAGSRALADRFELTDTLRDGVIENLLIVLEDGSRLAARRGERVDGVSRLERAVYSPCSVVDDDGCPREPVWSLKALRVVHDPRRGRVYYTGARLDFFGVPVVALPRLSHPDSLERSQTGLLTPDVRFSRELGLELRVPWYWSIAPDRDLTIGGRLFTNAPPLAAVEYRQLLAGGPIVIGGLATYGRGQAIDPVTGGIISTPARFRGYLDGRGQVEHGANWRSSFSARLTNDDNLLGRYQVSLDTRLRSTYALERFEPDRYFAVRGWAFQDLRPTANDRRTPFVLPLVELRWRVADPLFGGSILVEGNSLALYRREGQSMARALASARWERGFLSAMGHRLTLTALARGDLYSVSDSALADEPIYAGRDGWRARALPLVAADLEWPFAGPLLGGVQTIAPRVQLVASTTRTNGGIPNEDSRAIDLEESNLFALNRFPGYDRWEGGARLTYGGEWRWRGPGLEATVQLGQSYRFDDPNPLIPDGTGLADRLSDFVGHASLRFGRVVEVTQRVRLDKDSLAVRRNETDVAIGSRRTYVSVGYLRFNRNIALEDLVDHEEVRAGARVAFGRYWAAFGSAVIDLTSRAEDPLTPNDGFQPIRHRLGVSYTDECFDIGLTWKRNYVDNPNARRGNTFLFTLALRNLG